MAYYHVDVFSEEPLSGNGLTVMLHDEALSKAYMQRLAQEFKQFETIFLQPAGAGKWRARIFTVEEELDFAGHPILGAAAAVQDYLAESSQKSEVTFILNHKEVQVQSEAGKGCYHVTMNQGVPEMLGELKKKEEGRFLKALHLEEADRYPDYPMAVISTGLPYLIVPLKRGLERSKIIVTDLEAQLAKAGAKFVYVFDMDQMEGRTWDNFGKVEDVATGSAAGPMAAYLYHYGVYKAHQKLIIHQGRFVGRPSCIEAYKNISTGEISVSGGVRIIAKGQLLGENRT